MHTFLLLIASLASLCLVVFSYLALTSQLSLTLYVLLSLSISVILLFGCEYLLHKCYRLKKYLKTANTSSGKQQQEFQALNEKIATLEKELAEEKAKTVNN